MAQAAAPPEDRAATRFGQGYVEGAWYLAAMSAELRAGRLIKRLMLGQPVAIGRDATGEVHAWLDVCPHRAAPLSAGRVVSGPGGAEVECPYHGWRFGADGRCRAIPSLADGQDFEVGKVRVRTFPAVESQGMIFVLVSTSTIDGPVPPPPVFPGVVGGGPKLVLHDRFEAHVDHAVIGLMDPAHGPYVHRQWWWRSTGSAHQKEKRFEPRDEGFAMVRHAPSSNSRAYALLGGRPMTEITFRLPAYRYEHILVGRFQLMTLTALTPESETATRITQIVWSDHPVVSLLKPLVRLGGRRFLAQDRAMVDLQKAGLSRGAPLLWIDDADRQAKWYQALKREWRESRLTGRPFQNPVLPATLRWKS